MKNNNPVLDGIQLPVLFPFAGFGTYGLWKHKKAKEKKS